MSPWWMGDQDDAEADHRPVNAPDQSPGAATQTTGEPERRRGTAYAQHFDRPSARLHNVRSAADLVRELVAAGGSILDAGCGTGERAARLAEHGYLTVGVDSDGDMLSEARRRHPALTWITCDLADLTLERLGRRFDAIVAGGNVMQLLTPGTETTVITAFASVLQPGGLLIAGFGLDAVHLPPPVAGTAGFHSLTEYDSICSTVGLRLRDRWSSWDQHPFDDSDGGYAVSIHRLPSN